MYDKVAGTWFAQARQYRSNTGTFDGMDRFGGDITMPDTLNPYVYCLGDGFSHTDKSGYWCGVDDLIAAGLGAIAGAADTYWGKNKGRSMEGMLVKLTRIFVILFIVIAAVLNMSIF